MYYVLLTAFVGGMPHAGGPLSVGAFDWSSYFCRSVIVRHVDYIHCGMVRFPTGHYWHCNWPVKKASPGLYPCKCWTLWTLFVNKLLQTTCIFLCVFGSTGFYPSCHRFSVYLLCWCLMVDTPPLLNCKALNLLRTVNEQKVKCWYFAWC